MMNKLSTWLAKRKRAKIKKKAKEKALERQEEKKKRAFMVQCGCIPNGHNYLPTKTENAWGNDVVVLTCTKCGDEK